MDRHLNSIQPLNHKLLRKKQGALSVPFMLSLKNHEMPLRADEIVRFVPKKRLVVFGEWQNKKIVAKLFFGRRDISKEHWQRDLKGARLLQELNVPTPQLLHYDQSSDKRIQVLIFERMMEVQSLEALWEKGNEKEKLHLLSAFTLELATQHVLGILQHDLHLKNYLSAHDKIYTLDGGTIERFESPVDKEQSLDHLGLFFAQLGVFEQYYREALYQLYADARGWRIRPQDLHSLFAAIKKAQKIRKSRFQTKVFRRCTAFNKIQSFRRLMLCDRALVDQESLFKQPETLFSKDSCEWLKQGRSASVIKTTLHGQPLVVKRYNIKNIGHRLRRLFRKTRAAQGWRLGHMLHLMGIPTAKPIAFIENRFWKMRGRSYLLMDYLPGPHLGDYFANQKSDDPKTKAMVHHVIQLFKDLASLRLIHNDLKMTNIIVQQEKPYLIDLDSMRDYRCPIGFKSAFNKSIRRFMRNWETKPAIYRLFEEAFHDTSKSKHPAWDWPRRV